MPLPNRTTHEQALTAAITAEYDSLIAQAKANPASVNWTASEDETQRDAADEIATVYLLAMAGMTKITEQDFNQYVAIALATDYANQRSAEVVSNLYSDLRANVNQAASNAARSVAEGIPADEAKRRYEAELARIFEPIRPGTIGVTEVTAAISAGEYAVGKPDKDKWWMALFLLYGLPDAVEAWKNRQPGQPIRDLIGRPRMPRRRDLNEPAPGEWPTTTPRRELPKGPGDTNPNNSEPPSSGDKNQTTSEPLDNQPFPIGGFDGTKEPPDQSPQQSIPSVLMPYWQTEGDAAVCPVCSPLDGLAEDKYWTRFPGGPPAHPRCRCQLRWVDFKALDESADPKDGDGDGLIVDGKPTERPAGDKTKKRNPQVDTPEFKRWFGDSKVVDENGEPLVVYHYTDADFSEFSLKHANDYSDTNKPLKAFFFTDKKDVPAMGKIPSSVMPVFVKIEYPVPLYPDPKFWTKSGNLKFSSDDLLQKGYDGMLKKGKDGSYVDIRPFTPAQIKSATGNRGTFNPNSPKITESKG